MNERRVPVVCSAGTTDPWNAAGLGLDIRVLAEFGVRAVTVVAGISAQGPRGIVLLQPIAAAAVTAQFDALAEAGVDAFRIGALLDAANVRAVARAIAKAGKPTVYDPAIGASGGGRFADGATLDAIRAELLPRAALVTPNLDEARELAGHPGASAPEAARRLIALGARAVLVTGVHAGEEIEDLLVTPHARRRFADARLPLELRGTGCMLAAGIAASLASGFALEDAIVRARAFVRERLADGEAVAGMRVLRIAPARGV